MERAGTARSGLYCTSFLNMEACSTLCCHHAIDLCTKHGNAEESILRGDQIQSSNTIGQAVDGETQEMEITDINTKSEKAG